MRMLIQLQFPMEPFNTYVRDGSAGIKIQKILKSMKPEAAYFTEQEGHRGAVLVVDVKDSSDIPTYAEPWFLLFQAKAEFRIAMTPEDLANANLKSLGKQWKK